MLSFLRCLLCCDDEPNTGRIHHDESPSQSNNYQVIPNDYGTFSRNSLFLCNTLCTQTATRTQSQDYSTSFNFPQKPNIPSVSIFPKNDAKLISEKTSKDSSSTPHNVVEKGSSSTPHNVVEKGLSSTPHNVVEKGSSSTPHNVVEKGLSSTPHNVVEKGSSSTPHNVVEKGLSSTPHNVIPEDIKGLIQEASQLDLNACQHASCYTGSSTIVDSGQQTGDSVVPHNSSSKGYLKGKRKRRGRRSYGQLINDYPETSSNPSRTLPTKDVKFDINESPKQSMVVPTKRSLADYLCESGPRLVSLYGSTELYPTDEARCIIQGMVRTILNLKKDGKKHNYLRHPENIILGDKECHSYSNYVRDLASENVTRNRKILEQAGHDFSTTTMVTLEKNMTDLKSDDLLALKYLIFDVILVLDDDKKPLLPAEWISFKKLFSNTKLDYAVLSSHPCLWGYTKRLGFYFALDRWCKPSKSEKEVIDIVNDTLSCMKIFTTDWVEGIKKESHLLKFADKMTRSRQRKVYGLVRFFRNLVEHCSDEASSPYKKERYLDYKLRNIFPNLLEELYQRLLLAGFNY